MFNIIGLKSVVSLEPRIEASFDSLRVTLERGFPPANISCFICDFDKEPAWWHAEVLHSRYFPHLDARV